MKIVLTEKQKKMHDNAENNTVVDTTQSRPNYETKK